MRESGFLDKAPTIPLFVFFVEGQRCALSLPVVQRVLLMIAVSPLPEAPEVVLGVINLRGDVLPVVDVRRRLGFPPRPYGPAARLVVARTSRRALALAVDEAHGVAEVDAATITSADDLVPGTRYVAGIVALPDGLLFIHDLDTLLSLDDERRLDQALGGVQR